MNKMVGALIIVVKSLLIVWGVFYLAERLGWSLVRQAGGGVV